MSHEPMSSAPSRQATSATRAGGTAGAVTAAVAVWLVARYGAGVALRQPAFSARGHPAHLAVGFVIVVSTVASLAGWGVAGLFGRAAHHPRITWVIIATVATALSLSLPPSGHGITSTQRLALACMHLALAAVLVPAFAASLPTRRRSARDPARALPHRRNHPASRCKPPRIRPELGGDLAKVLVEQARQASVPHTGGRGPVQVTARFQPVV